MMGRQEDGQRQFFYAFDLDKVVPSDYLVRQIDPVLDLGCIYKDLAPYYYSHTGRPSIDPVLMMRMLIVGDVFAIRSERRLCSEVQVNLAYRWFCSSASRTRSPIIRCSAVPGDQPIAWPKAEEASRAVREYLAVLDAARNDEESGDGDGGGSSGDGGSRRKPPKEVSLTDPQATWVARPGVDPFFAYDANYLIDNKVGAACQAPLPYAAPTACPA
jgi:hypothetical protein